MKLGEMCDTLDKVAPAETIPDADMEMMLTRFSGNLSLYYIDGRHDRNKAYEVGEYAVQFLETPNGYLTTIVNKAKRIFRKKFAVISYGDWIYDDSIFGTLGAIDTLLDATKKSNEFLDAYGVSY